MDAVTCPAVQNSEDSKDHSDSGVSSQTLISSDIYPAVIAIYLMQNKHYEWVFHYLFTTSQSKAEWYVSVTRF